jgi:deoxyribonuclease V
MSRVAQQTPQSIQEEGRVDPGTGRTPMGRFSPGAFTRSSGHGRGCRVWPSNADSLIAYQRRLAAATPEPWTFDPDTAIIGGCWVCFPRGLVGPGSDHDPAWSAAMIMFRGRMLEQQVISGIARAAYVPGLMALRLGPLMEETVRALTDRPNVLLLDATAGDHPRRAGLALHLGAELDVPTIGVTHRPLVAHGEWPRDQRGATSPLMIEDSVVGCWLRTQPGVRPLAVHPGWRIDLGTAVAVVTTLTRRRRTPEPLRRARELARRARAQAANPNRDSQPAKGHLSRG